MAAPDSPDPLAPTPPDSRRARMDFALPDDPRGFQKLWGAVHVVRKTPFHLFTFGETALPYKLVLEPKTRGGVRGPVRGRDHRRPPHDHPPGPGRPAVSAASSRAMMMMTAPPSTPATATTTAIPTPPAGPIGAGAMGDDADGERVVRFLMSRGVKLGELNLRQPRPRPEAARPARRSSWSAN